MRPRDPVRLEAGEYDLLVVGGGIHGLTIAYDAASRGLRTALVEASDFGAGTSFNHQKTAHGGLRALQSGRVDRALESIFERRALARIAPWLLRPLPFLIGTYRSAVKNRLAMRAALRFDAWLGRHRNEGVEPELHLPAPKLLSKAATLRLFAGINPRHLTGGAQWYDYQMVESERLTVAFAAAADQHGADLANYVEARAALKDAGRVVGMHVYDRETGREFAVRARLTINAAGARAGDIMQIFGVSRPYPLLKAINLVTSKPASDIALAAPTAAGRMLTLVPWHGRAVIGTGQSDGLVQPGDLHVSGAEIDGFIAEANQAFPALELTRNDVRLVHRGAVPAETDKAGTPGLRAAPEIYDHATEGAPGAMTIVGVKYTLARGVAERAVDACGTLLGRPLPRSRTATTPLPGAAIADHEALAIETARAAAMDLPTELTQRLSALYAEAAAGIVRLIADRPEWGEAVANGCQTVGAEIVHVIRHEMAIRLTDVVIRRTTIGSGGHPGAGAVAACGRIAAQELGWEPARLTQEIAAVDAFYAMGS
ncbi:MAG TPA: FAD-dependent oxidoreductase [Vicinamibacterales bacterium]|nr:FAD-dependent oxidoreductase [Vicinamibacterales bacterium]